MTGVARGLQKGVLDLAWGGRAQVNLRSREAQAWP